MPAMLEGLQPQPRFLAIWLALLVLIVVSAIFVPRSLMATSILAIIPFAAFLCIASMGEALVLRWRAASTSSIPAVITLSSSLILGISGGQDAALGQAVVVALAVSAGVGLINGVLVSNFRLNPLVVTLAVGTIMMGAAIWYREGIAQEARVPPILCRLGRDALPLDQLLGVGWRWRSCSSPPSCCASPSYGRRFTAVGANPRRRLDQRHRREPLQGGGLTPPPGCSTASPAILLAAFIRNPTLDVGAAYLLAPIAAAVLGGTAIGGGPSAA